MRQIITPEGELVSRQCVPGKQCPCVFEYIYLARPDSVLDDIPVYNFQLGLGTRLARRIRDKVRPGYPVQGSCSLLFPAGPGPAPGAVYPQQGAPEIPCAGLLQSTTSSWAWACAWRTATTR